MTKDRPHVCRGCGRRDGAHDRDCRSVERAARRQLQAECDHRPEYNVTRTTGDPLGPPCCGRCDLELPVRADMQRPYARVCEGYVYFADQGIEVCETCGGCTCCRHEEVDHRKARYRCLLDREGKECLIAGNSNFNHACKRDQP